jgi:hypothetical protein
MNKIVSLVLIALIITSLVLIVLPSGTVGTPTSVSGLITSDTVWTKAGSPYTLTGNTQVDNGVTLTIEPGVTVNLINYYLQINGTLQARGTPGEIINFTTGGAYSSPYMSIAFTEFSTRWNEQTQVGCIIENANLTLDKTFSIKNSSPKISNCSIRGTVMIEGGSPIIANNNIKGIATGGAVIIEGGSPEIDYNDISSVYHLAEYGVSFYGSNNAYIHDNTIHDVGEAGIGKFPGVGPATGTARIERNLIACNPTGIDITANAIIQKNTFQNNSVAIHNPSSSTVIANNTFQNAQYSIQLEYNAAAVNATYNWWGTTNTTAINQSIYDYNDDFNLGKVTFDPILTAPNSDAPTCVIVPVCTDGKIVPNGVIKLNYGESKLFTIIPDNGYRVFDVQVNGSSIGAVKSYNAQNIKSATTLYASFTEDLTPSSTPTPTPTSTSTSIPTPTPPPTATATPTNQPTTTPTANPSSNPTSNPTVQPTEPPTPAPSPTPTAPELTLLFIPITLTILTVIALETTRNRRRTLC